MPTFNHIHYQQGMNEADILALSSANNAVAGQFYYAIDTAQYFVGQLDGTAMPFPATFNLIDLAQLCGDLPFKAAVQTETFNIGTHTVADSSVFDSFITARPNLQNAYFYRFTWLQGMKNNLINPNLRRLRQYFGSTNGNPWPEMPIANSLIEFRIQSDADAPSSIPASWTNAKRLQQIRYQRNGLSSVQCDNMTQDFETRILGGMGSLYNGIHYLYLNATGTNANARPTLATHIANAWTDNGTYLSKTIAGKNCRVYYNP
ncbi:MAG: hypothetical protein ACPG5B_16725 [Chitinophagales bacterium]